jgi:CheY-like chemotaxis protein
VSYPTIEILLVEDSLEDSRLIADALKQTHPAVSITIAHDGVEALDCIFNTGPFASRSRPYTPHLILLDLNLPRVSGREVLRVLRAYARTRVIPVVVISGTPEERAIADSYELGANSYLMKPTSGAQFREAVRQMAAYWLTVSELYQPDDSAAANDGDRVSSHTPGAET